MKKLALADIRSCFLDFFVSKGHHLENSASLVTGNDPTLHFVNAGMVPFKNLFLGLEDRPYTTATSCQKCVRAGGKHNDLENVGFTSRHHTFFEMLGNFSFGDYFKEEAMLYAWEFVTKELALPTDRLRVTVFHEDDESAKLWKKISGLSDDRIVRFGEEDNFWSMGETGPCGPCSEIFWDQGEEVDGDRWLEIWNLVFMQYDRRTDGTLVPLAKKSVDTGMGLERIAAVMQGVKSNYEADLLRSLMEKTSKYIQEKTGRNISITDTGREGSALRVIVDHLRSTSFMIADGVLPSNEGRGYVLRRILRRAVRFGRELGLNQSFLYGIYTYLQEGMGEAYPELYQRENVVTDILKQEEDKFFETLGRGLELLEGHFNNSVKKSIAGDVAFKLYDSFGFPLDLTELIAREKGFTVDRKVFDRCMSEQKDRSRKSWKGSGDQQLPAEVIQWQKQKIHPRWIAYESKSSESQVLAKHDSESNTWVSIDPCPFYAESGGQVADIGQLALENSDQAFNVIDVRKAYDDGVVLLLEGVASELKIGDRVRAQVKDDRRSLVRANHTATHLLHAALREILGTHVQQSGSFLDENRLRFDFSHGKSISDDELCSIEKWVNQRIREKHSLKISQMPYDSAIEKGAMALFGEKYTANVRVVDIPSVSMELCGGLHVSNTSEISFFKVVKEEAVAAGTRRIEAVCSEGAIRYFLDRDSQVDRVANLLKVAPGQIEDRVERLLQRSRELEKNIEKLEQKLARTDDAGDAEKVDWNGFPVQLHFMKDLPAKLLREKGDFLRQKEPKFAHVIVSSPQILVTANTAEVKGFHSGDFLRAITAQFGGRGGGQDKTAQGKIEDLSEKKSDFIDWLKQ